MADRVFHDSIPIMEWFLFHHPEIRVPFMSLGAIDPSVGRNVSAVDHPELNGMLSDFNVERGRLRVVAVLGNVIQFAILRSPNDDERKRRVHPAVFVTGPLAEVERLGWGGITNRLYGTLELKEFLPPPMCRKIVFMEGWSGSGPSGVCFTEVGKLLWTVGDPFTLPVRNVARAGGREIIAEIMEDIKEGGQS